MQGNAFKQGVDAEELQNFALLEVGWLHGGLLWRLQRVFC